MLTGSGIPQPNRAARQSLRRPRISTSECLPIGAETHAKDTAIGAETPIYDRTVSDTVKSLSEGAGRHIPKMNCGARALCLRPTPTCECLSIWAETHACNIKGIIYSEFLFYCAGGDIPQLNRGGIAPSTVTAACEYLSIGTKTRTGDSTGVSAESLAVFAGSDIPEANCFVLTSTGECVAIRTETHAINCVGMSDEGLPDCAGNHVPQPNPSVPTAICKYLSVWTETYAIDAVGVADEGLAAFAGGDIPEANPAVRTPTCKCLSIGTETHALDINGVSDEDLLEGVSVDIP